MSFFLPAELLFRSEIEWLEYAIWTNLVKAEVMGIDTAAALSPNGRIL